MLTIHGYVYWPLEFWYDMAKRANLPATLISKVIDRWCQDGTDAVAFLESPSRDHYRLSKHHALCNWQKSPGTFIPFRG